MLRMGFAEEIDVILAALPVTRRTALFSATMPPAIRSMAARHLNDPIDVTVAAPTMAAALVRQQYAVVNSPERTAALVRVLSTRESGASLVFVRTRANCQELGAELAAHGIAAAAISGDIAQPERERIIERLRDGRLRVLVATDVAARGLDVDRIDHVVNYGAPNDVESYVHRIGRTGRAGRTGEALTLVTPREISRIRTIERFTGVRMTEITPPTAADVVAQRAAALLASAIDHLGSADLGRHRQAVTEILDRDGIDAPRLAAALIALAVGDYPSAAEEAASQLAIKAATRNRPDRDRADRSDRPDRDRADRSSPWNRDGEGPRTAPRRTNTTDGAPVYRIEVGRSHGVRPAAIVGAITGEGGMAGKDVGRIDIYDTYSIVEISAEVTPVAWDRISRAKVSGQSLKIRHDRAGREVDAKHTPPRRGDTARSARRDFDGPKESTAGSRRPLTCAAERDPPTGDPSPVASRRAARRACRRLLRQAVLPASRSPERGTGAGATRSTPGWLSEQRGLVLHDRRPARFASPIGQAPRRERRLRAARHPADVGPEPADAQ